MPSSVSIRELARAIMPKTAAPKVLALLRSYLDESYNPQRMLIAGFVGTDAEWEAVGEQWAEALEKHDAPYFHGCELNMQRGPFERWERWRCDALKKRCGKILSGSNLGEISAGFIGDWSSVTRQAPDMGERFPSAYAFCFEMAVAQMQRAAKRWYGGDSVACIFDVQDEHSPHATDVFKQRKALGLWPNVASVAYADDLDVIQLQCADMLSNENWQCAGKGEAFVQSLPLISLLHKRERSYFSGKKQWEETLLRVYSRDPALKEILDPTPPPESTR